MGSQTLVAMGRTMSDIALRFDHVRKEFRHYASPLHRLRSALLPFGGGHPVPVPVLDDVSFSIRRGESVAIVGANGVGKSTVLHLIAGLLQPTDGTIEVNGRVTALLDLGGSFLPDLTGRENARFYHRLITRDRDASPALERAVEEFAELGDFFDRPVRTYSSGMFLRLAFSCAVAEQPDIIVIDEVLAVGDARFQQKCYRRLTEFRERGATIILVTHVMNGLTTICDRVLVLDRAQLAFDGDPARGIDRYYQLFFTAPQHAGDDNAENEFRYGFGGAAITEVRAFSGDLETRAIRAGDAARIVFDVEFSRDVEAPYFSFSCATKEGTRIYGTSSSMLGLESRPAVAGERRRIEIHFQPAVGVGDLFVDLAVFESVAGADVVLDARVHVLHLTVPVPRHYIGVSDIAASMHYVS